MILRKAEVLTPFETWPLASPRRDIEGEPLELLGGQLVVAEPKGAYHGSAVSSAEYAMRAALPKGWIVP